MKRKKIEERIESDYDLELDRVVRTIKKQKARLVCLQLPDALKPLATKIAAAIESKTAARCLIWAGSCYGACDLPSKQLSGLNIDLLIQWGHTPWPKLRKRDTIA